MKDMQAVHFNEKVKRVSTLIGGEGLAFILPALTRWTDKGFEPSTAVWIVSGIVAILMSVKVNDLLDPEDEA